MPIFKIGFDGRRADGQENVREVGHRNAPGEIWLGLGLGRADCFCGVRDGAFVMNNHNATLCVYDDTDRDVVPPFLVGEVAGSLSIDTDREQLSLFAEAILDWLTRTKAADGATVYRFTPGNGTTG
jgi:hypothetical protein